VHHVGILYDQFMMHGQRNIKLKDITNFTIGCRTRYRARYFFNNFTTNENIVTKFEADYRHTLQTHSFSFLTQRTYSCNIFIGDRIIKEIPGSVASGTHCIISAGLGNILPHLLRKSH